MGSGSEVGAEPGTVVRTARPREGLGRPKIAWVLWSEWPAVLDDAFAALEKLRGDAGRTVRSAWSMGRSPEGQAGAVKRGALEVMTLRRFAFQLANVDEHLAELRVHCDQVLLEGFVPRLVEREDGETMDGVKAVLEWCESATPDALLWLVGPDPQIAKVERERLRLENGFYAGLTVLTYDDLIERARSLLDFLLRHRNGSSSS